MKTYYIGNRLTPQQMRDVLGEGNVHMLNTGMSNQVASVAMKQGIKKTQNGLKLTFYAVDSEQFETLMDESTKTLVALKSGLEWRPLIVVDRELLKQKIDEVNSKYPRRMDNATARVYNADLLAAIDSAVKKVDEDKKIQRPKGYNSNNIKVGDIVSERLGRRNSTCAIVTNVTETGYTVRAWEPKHHTHHYMHKLGMDINDITGSISYPIAGNEEEFVMGEPKRYRFTAKHDHWNPTAITEGHYQFGVYSYYWDHGD